MVGPVDLCVRHLDELGNVEGKGEDSDGNHVHQHPFGVGHPLKNGERPTVIWMRSHVYALACTNAIYASYNNREGAVVSLDLYRRHTAEFILPKGDIDVHDLLSLWIVKCM